MNHHGWQIFIVDSDSSRRDKLVHVLRRHEYETYGLTAAEAARLKYEEESVVYVFGATLPKALQETVSSCEFPLHLVGCGAVEPSGVFDDYVQGAADEMGSLLLDHLHKLGARGGRLFVRFGNQHSSIATFEFHNKTKRFAGIVHDMSASALSFTFRPEPQEADYRDMDSMQLNLPDRKVVIPGFLDGQRVAAGHVVHVFKFEDELDENLVDEIYSFIYSALQMKLSWNSRD